MSRHQRTGLQRREASKGAWRLSCVRRASHSGQLDLHPGIPRSSQAISAVSRFNSMIRTREVPGTVLLMHGNLEAIHCSVRCVPTQVADPWADNLLTSRRAGAAVAIFDGAVARRHDEECHGADLV